MTYGKRLTFLVLLDSLIVLSAIYVSVLTLHPTLEIFKSELILISSITLLMSHHFFASLYRLYNKAWEYASVRELVAIVKAVSLSIMVTGAVQQLLIGNVYFRALMLAWMMHVLLIGGSRFSWRVYRDRYIKPAVEQKRAMIIGAGAAGTMLARQLLKNKDAEIKPVAFIDDDPKKNKLHILGLPVVGNSKRIKKMAETLDIDHIVIAIPSLSKDEMKRIYEECAGTRAKTVIMPLIEDVMLGNVSFNQFRDVQVEDLLGRDPVELDINSISKKLTGKTILVTGAGGSIGSEICRQVCKFKPKKLLLLGHGENSIYQIDMELRNQYRTEIEILPVIADIQDGRRIFEVMDIHRPDAVYHAAAHKHVPLMEYNPKEAVKNNVIGTKNVAEAADTFGVRTFVLVSSDKAVNPTNVMGSTKRIAEMVIQEIDKHSATKFVAVRFGNVLGSRGSVIPLFKKQIQAGGPVTVTHPEMTRYFMTIPEASRLVMQAGALARGGEVFVLDMGEPVKIVDLARNLITLSGYSEEEIGIKFSGIRPGEKMFEELLNEKEVHKEAVFPKIFIGKAVLDQEDEVHYLIENFGDMSSEEISEFVLNLANRRGNRMAAGVE
ncbi:polysaccharide biosynthesis protein EpsC [Cytobacillus firmus]|uniref:polysaccharide biosynthesis protein n=1 Tax=Cytobacillus firmus TaxID=1399 RepID=UPI00077C11B4|nr:nucleoside-diphosphate sugar epimerase/dehydratase [Cytobacillus firmus]MBG9543265.1 polysaccharide biosynthesis protein EpsC [Cytobacillus firmus]MBG9551521.1 polysaccharide biosynthesis protein EpsC [Cytobacillus firmus]MBG9558410.1 polysaccharide biosynthesis protein EpsC [Cytobacillus firmus]MBG9575701.1 polysaccharide biosynthesis protein EpsC [Cytobacillus firmus]MEC1894284.1 nucleoside-diphosphate sugar epimerase/dehydratase [Cytobacillus firmus]